MSNAPVQPGDILASKYRVERILGIGGMGVVVQAIHIHLDDRVALKFMLPEAMANPEAAGRFLREARLAVKLKSEHVAKVMDVGTLESGAPYIVMEYLEGRDLNQLLETRGPLPFVDVAEYVIQACDAIAEAHALNIVHRDLKPANLFLTRRPDGAPLVKVLDFGISKANTLGEGGLAATQAATMMGSPYFMSPEQMRSAKDVDTRSDVWSVGVILYQLLTGRLPFDSDTLGGIMVQVLQEEAVPIATYRPDLPPAFDAIIRRCLQRETNVRAQNVGEIAAALTPHAPERAKPIADRIVSLLGIGGPSPTGTLVMRATAATPPPLSMTELRGPAPSISRPLIPAYGGAPQAALPTSGNDGAARAPGAVTGAPAVTTATSSATPRERSSGAGVVVAAVVLGIGLGGGAYFWYQSNHRGAAQGAAEPAGEAPAGAAPSMTSTASAAVSVDAPPTTSAAVSVDVPPTASAAVSAGAPPTASAAVSASVPPVASAAVSVGAPARVIAAPPGTGFAPPVAVARAKPTATADAMGTVTPEFWAPPTATAHPGRLAPLPAHTVTPIAVPVATAVPTAAPK